jgi:hypothetical protein
MDTTVSYLTVKMIEWEAEVRKTLLTTEDQEELKTHLEDIIEELSPSNLSQEEIWTVAMNRIGSLPSIEREFIKVNPDVSFRKNSTILIYGAVLMLLFQSIFILLPAFIYNSSTRQTAINNLSDDTYWPIIYNSLIVFFVVVIIALIIKGKGIMKYFSRLVTKFNVIAAFVSVAIIISSAFFIIQLLNVRGHDNIGDVAPKFKIITQIFYLFIIGLIVYFLLINKRNEVRNILTFNRRITWKIALLIGAGAFIVVCFSYTYRILYLPLIIGCPLFAFIGWMLSYSDRKILNLFCSQLFIMFLSLSELSGMHSSIFISYYCITVICLIIGLNFKKVHHQLFNVIIFK